MDGTTGVDAALATLRAEMTDVILGTVFLSIGAAACAIGVIRWNRGVRILIWWGIWSGMYGLQTLDQTPIILVILPKALKSAAPYLSTGIMYLLLVSALFAWRELSLGKVRLLIELEILVGLAIALLGVGTFVVGGPDDRWMFYNNLLAVFAMLVLLAIVLVPKFASKFLVIPNHRILAAGTLIFAVEALYTNLSSVLRYRTLPLVAPLGFAALLFSMGYVALEIVSTNDRRLFAIETELETARQIQASILPASTPEVQNLRIGASYQPMTAVAGDFYQFVRVDNYHLGILVADVSGHGIPAALISSMIKVAMQSITGFADDPARVLGSLNHILSTELRGQLTSAAYLWIDSEKRTARYSAAGHPPLLYWRDASGELQRIESNGLLFGVVPEQEYPVRTLAIEFRDRFLIYTDGLTEPENARGESFGDGRLEQVVRDNRSQTASELTPQLLSELRKWQPVPTSQQDDITLIVVDVL
ncbi:MAG: PP2C family protein-serine/threonine phosphatase [Terriglobales bacterium]